MGGQSSTGKVQFYSGQKEFAGSLFEPGGLFDRIRRGQPAVGAEQAAARRQQEVGREFAARGQEGSGLEARAISDAAFQGDMQREASQLENLLAIIQPAGAKQHTTGGLLSMFTK